MQNYKAKTVKMIGFSGREEDVVPARERILELKSLGIPYTIGTEYLEVGSTQYFKTTLIIQFRDPQIYTGSSVVRRDEVGGFEAAETRSIGRAIAAYGIGIETSYASADEISGQTVDPGATNSVKETLAKLEEVKQRRGASLEEQDVDPVLSDYKEFPEVIDSPTKQELKRRKTAAKNVVEKPTLSEEPPKEYPEEPEILENKDENVPEVAENPIIEAHVENPPQDSIVTQEPIAVQEENWFHKPEVKAPVIEPQTVYVEAKEKVETKVGNQFDVEIPELQNGKRDFGVYMPMLMALNSKDVDVSAFNPIIEKLGLVDFISKDKNTEHWELLFRTAGAPIINQVLNAWQK